MIHNLLAKRKRGGEKKERWKPKKKKERDKHTFNGGRELLNGIKVKLNLTQYHENNRHHNLTYFPASLSISDTFSSSSHVTKTTFSCKEIIQKTVFTDFSTATLNSYLICHRTNILTCRALTPRWDKWGSSCRSITPNMLLPAAATCQSLVVKIHMYFTFIFTILWYIIGRCSEPLHLHLPC